MVVVTGAAGSCQLSPIDTASGSATATVQVFHPCVGITKNCPAICTQYGQSITVSGTVTNCGDETLLISLSDAPAATFSPTNQATLAAGATFNYTATYTPAPTAGPLDDTVTVVSP